MTSKEFILWLKGFTEAIDTPTNAHWDILKDYCNDNNMIYKITNIPPLTNYEFKCLIETKKVKLTNRYIKKYEELYQN